MECLGKLKKNGKHGIAEKNYQKVGNMYGGWRTSEMVRNSVCNSYIKWIIIFDSECCNPPDVQTESHRTIDKYNASEKCKWKQIYTTLNKMILYEVLNGIEANYQTWQFILLFSFLFFHGKLKMHIWMDVFLDGDKEQVLPFIYCSLDWSSRLRHSRSPMGFLMKSDSTIQ